MPCRAHEKISLSDRSSKMPRFLKKLFRCKKGNEEHNEKRSDITNSDEYEDISGKTVQKILQARGDNQFQKKLSLEELKKMSPPGYQEFEAAVALNELNEDIALLLWEDIFKPLSSHFESLKGDSEAENSLPRNFVKCT